MKIHLGENIQALRRARSLTQEQLAQAMGVTVGAVSKWEKGSCCPDMQLLPELAEFFGTSVDVLLGVLSGLLPRSGESYVTKLLALLHAARATILHENGREQETEGELARALDCARRFDASPARQESSIRFAAIQGFQFYDDTGETAEKGVRDIVRQQNSDALTAMLMRVGREK